MASERNFMESGSLAPQAADAHAHHDASKTSSTAPSCNQLRFEAAARVSAEAQGHGPITLFTSKSAICYLRYEDLDKSQVASNGRDHAEVSPTISLLADYIFVINGCPIGSAAILAE